MKGKIISWIVFDRGVQWPNITCVKEQQSDLLKIRCNNISIYT
jgi:hypothetical protein